MGWVCRNFTLQGSYRPNLQFFVEDKDTVASSNLLNEDYFTPSMAVQAKSKPPTTSSPAVSSSLASKDEPSRPPFATPFPSQPDSLPSEASKPRQYSATYAQRPKFGSVSSRAMMESLNGVVGGGGASGLGGRSLSESGILTDAMDRARRNSETEERAGVSVPSRERRTSFYGDDKASSSLWFQRDSASIDLSLSFLLQTTHSPSSLSLSRRPTLTSIQTFRSGTLSSSPAPSPPPFRPTATQPLSSYTASPSSSLIQPRPTALSSLSREVGSYMSSIGGQQQQPIPINRLTSSSAASQYPPLPLSMPDSPKLYSGNGEASPLPVPSSSSTTPAVPIAPPISKRYSSSFGHRQGRSFSTLSSSVASSITRQQGVAAPIVRTGSGGGSGGSLTRGVSFRS